MRHDKPAIRREICWTLSNITAGTAQQGQTVLNNEQILKNVFDMA